MQKDALIATISMNAALISACEKGHHEVEAREMFADIQQRDRSPEVIAYNTLIRACGKGNEVEKALKLYGDMQLRGLIPDETAYTALSVLVRKAASRGGKEFAAMQRAYMAE